jgi:hypothetical protein
LLGYSKEEFVGKELWEIGAMIDKAASIKAFAVLKKDGCIKYDDLPLRTKSGEIIRWGGCRPPRRHRDVPSL